MRKNFFYFYFNAMFLESCYIRRQFFWWNTCLSLIGIPVDEKIYFIELFRLVKSMILRSFFCILKKLQNHFFVNFVWYCKRWVFVLISGVFRGGLWGTNTPLPFWEIFQGFLRKKIPKPPKFSHPYKKNSKPPSKNFWIHPWFR